MVRETDRQGEEQTGRWTDRGMDRQEDEETRNGTDRHVCPVPGLMDRGPSSLPERYIYIPF